MIFEGNSEVMTILKQKKSLIDAGLPHEHIKPLLIIDGGLMKGVYGTGAALAIDELGYTNCFSAVAGISSGAVAAAYLLSGTKIGASTIYEEACSRQFRPRFSFKNIIDVAFFERVLAGDTGKALQFDKISSHIVSLYIGVSEFTTGKPVIIRPTNLPDLLRSIRASISIPGAVTLPSYVNGVRYVDGAASKPHILKNVYETIEATHVLVITNQDKDTKHISWIEHCINNTIFRFRMTAALRTVTNWRRESRHEFVQETLASPAKPTLFVWGDNSISSKESSPAIVRKVLEKSKAWWLQTLSQ